MFKTQTNHQNQNKTRQNKVRNKNFKSNRESISGSVIGSKNIQNINKSPKAKQIRGEQNNWIDKILKKPFISVTLLILAAASGALLYSEYNIEWKVILKSGFSILFPNQ